MWQLIPAYDSQAAAFIQPSPFAGNTMVRLYRAPPLTTPLLLLAAGVACFTAWWAAAGGVWRRLLP
jgi:hypothetical protein